MYVLCLQIFHVAIEERRYKSKMSPFGTEHNQAGIVRDIMTKTGCKIETNESKDQTLTVMITGKPSAVKEAHRQIKSYLQTKVTVTCILVHVRSFVRFSSLQNSFLQIICCLHYVY